MSKTRKAEVYDEDDAVPDEFDAPNAASARHRKTLGEMAAETRQREAEAAGGVACPSCGCRMSRVTETWDVAGGRRRKRVCRHCQRPWCTTES